MATLLGCLAVVWAVFLAGSAAGRLNAPMNDDMYYAHGAFLFARGLGPHYWGTTTMPLLGQWAWSWPFLKVLGESHVSLRLSTVVLSLVGVAAFLDLLLQAGLPPRTATFVAACLGLNPLYFLLSATYMGDVPSLAFSLAALALYGRALGTGHAGYLAAAAAVALLGAVTRQYTVAVPVAVGLSLLRRPVLRTRPLWLLAVAAPIAVSVGTHLWLGSRPDVYRFAFQVPDNPRRLLIVAFTLVIYSGLATTPVLLLRPRAGSGRFFVAAFSGLTGAAVYGFTVSQDLDKYLFIRDYDGAFLFPYTGNMISPWGTCVDVKNSHIVLGNPPLLLPFALRLALSAAGCLAGAALLARLLSVARRGLSVGPLPAFTVVNVGLVLLIPPTHCLVDRYILPMLPGALLLAILPVARESLNWRAGLASLVVCGLVSVGLAHDWFAWNAARWSVGRRALARGVAFQDIEGGFEFNREYYLKSYEADRAAFRDQEPVLFRTLVDEGMRRRFVRPWGVSLRYAEPVATGRYGLSFSILPGTRVVDSEPYRLWLTPGERRFYLVEALPSG